MKYMLRARRNFVRNFAWAEKLHKQSQETKKKGKGLRANIVPDILKV